MAIKPTVLATASLLYLGSCLAYTLIHYRQLSEGEGWGVVGMTGLFFIGLITLAIDLVVLKQIKDRSTRNLAGLFIVLAAAILLLLY